MASGRDRAQGPSVRPWRVFAVPAGPYFAWLRRTAPHEATGRTVGREIPAARTDALDPATDLLPDRRHLRVHGLPGRCRARPRAGHPRGPGRSGVSAPSGPTSGWPSSRATPPSCRWRPGQSIARSTARCCSTPSSAAISGSGDAGATSARRRRASATRARASPISTSSSSSTSARAIQHKVAGQQELVGSDVIVVHRLLKNDVVETTGHRGLRADQPGVHRCRRARPGRARHAGAHRDLRPDRRRAGLGARSRGPLAGGGGARSRLRRPGGVDPRRVRADRRPAAGRLGVHHEARPADVVAAVGHRGVGRGRDRRPARPRLGQPLHARQGRGRRGDPRLAAVRLRHRPDGPRDADRADQAAPHGRVRADDRAARRSTSATRRRRPSARRS